LLCTTVGKPAGSRKSFAGNITPLSVSNSEVNYGSTIVLEALGIELRR